MVGRLAVIAAVVVGAGCYAPAFKDCELACAAGDACPDGFDCMGQVCRPNGTMPGLACPGGMPDAPGPDAFVIPPHPRTTWGTPTMVVTVANGIDDPSLTGDRLEMFANMGNRIVVATRATDSSSWGNFVDAPGLFNGNPVVMDIAPHVSTDGLTMYWASDRTGGLGSVDIWMATRTSRGQGWTNAVHLSALNSQGVDSGGSLSADGLTMVVTSDRPGAASADVFVSTRATTTMNAWSVPTPIAEVNSVGNDSHAIMSPDELTIYFHSNRNLTAPNDFNLYEAHRASKAVGFDAPRSLGELSTTSYEGDPWVSPDGHHMFFARADGNGFTTIWEASR